MAVKEILLFILNLIILMGGVLLVVSGVSITLFEVKQLITDISTLFHVIGILAIVTGSLISLLALIGCCSAIIKNIYVFNVYIVITSLVLLLEVAVVITVYGLQNHRQKEAIDKLKDSMQNYYDKKSTVASQWDSVQNTSKCCGIEGPSDWVMHNDRGESLPHSCCEINRNDCTVESAHTMGCLLTLGYFTQQEYQLSGVIVGVVFISQILAMIITCRILVEPRPAKWDRPP